MGSGRRGKFSRSGYVSVEVAWHRSVWLSSGFGNWCYGIASRCLRWCQGEDGLNLMYWSPVYMVYRSQFCTIRIKYELSVCFMGLGAVPWVGW